MGRSQSLGETAPVRWSGMVGFVACEYPEGFVSGFTDANSAMPAQIYTWASRADPGFYEKAWGGIIMLLLFLITMNAIAIILRRRCERRWEGPVKNGRCNNCGERWGKKQDQN